MRKQIREMVVRFPEEHIPDFFYLLFWNLYKFGCFPSSNYVFQDASKKIHEFRYEVCVKLNENTGTHVNLYLCLDSKKPSEHKLKMKLGKWILTEVVLTKKYLGERNCLDLNEGLMFGLVPLSKRPRSPKI